MLPALYTLLLVLSLFCSSIAMFGPPGVFVFVLAGLLPLLLYSFRSLLWAILCFTMILFLLALVMSASCVAREAARRCQCRNNMKQIVLALLNYEQQYKCFPPAAVLDNNNRPMHSWRVLILPYIEGDSCSKHYDFNEPWDGPNNKILLSQRSLEYACPSDGIASMHDGTCTSYVAVVGSGTAWSQLAEGRGMDNDSIEAGKSILLVETADANVGWTEPRDLYLGELNLPNGVKATSKHMRSNGLFHHDSLAGVHVALRTL